MIEDMDGKKRLINELIDSAAIILYLREIVAVFTICGLRIYNTQSSYIITQLIWMLYIALLFV